jgi:hypothetical protein
LAEAIALAPKDGLFVEFGVATGTTLRQLAQSRPCVGFDSFEGLPEAWNGHEVGAFAQVPPHVPGAHLVISRYGPDTFKTKVPCALLHVDCDLYSSTKIALAWFAENRVPGAIVVFDEFFGYEGCEEHEQRAWRECNLVGEELFRSDSCKQKIAFRVP